MACLLTAGLPLPCKNFMPGGRRIAIANFFSGTSYGENFAYTVDANTVITGATLTTGKAYVFDMLKESIDVQDKENLNPNNGTSSYDSSISFYLSQYSTATRNKMVALANQKLLIFVEDRNGQWFCYGTDGTGINPSTSNGCDLVDSTGTIGKGYAADQNGYTLTATCTERVPPLEINATVMNTLLAV
jgi:hypothetical protein